MKAFMKLGLIILAMILMLGVVWTIGCGDDDDDDDDDSTSADDDEDDDDDVASDDDDDVVDDDDDTGDDDDNPCEGLYDVIFEGQTNFSKSPGNWELKLDIKDTGTMIGVVVPAGEEMDQYAVSGFRYDETTGYVRGTFPTPDTMSDCTEEKITNYMDFTVTAGALDGDVSFYCGEEMEEEFLIGIYDATGTTTCGDFSS